MLCEGGSGYFDLRVCERLSDSLEDLSGQGIDILVYDVEQSDPSDAETLKSLRASNQALYVYLLLPTRNIDLDAIFSSGHFDGYLPKNYGDSEQLEFLLRSARELANSKRALRNTETSFQEYLDEDADWLWESGSEFAFRKFSENFEAESGFKEADYLSKRLDELCDFETMGGDIKEYQTKTLNHQPFRNVEIWVKDAGGISQWFLVTGHPVFDFNNQFAGYRGSGKDITLEKHMEIELSENKVTLEKILNSAAEGFLVMTAIFSGSGEIADFCIKRVNRAAEEILGDKTHQLLGKLMKIELPFLVTHGIYEQARNALLSDAPFNTEISVDEPKLRGWFSVSGAKLADGVVLTISDITMRKEAELEARQDSKLKSVGQLASGIAHEINTPTQYIGDNLGFIQSSLGSISRVLEKHDDLVAAARESGEYQEQIEAIQKVAEEEDIPFLLEEAPEAARQALDGTERVRTIVLAMKEFSHPGSEGVSEVDVNRALETTITVSKSEWKSIANIEVEFDASLPHIYAMSSELNQVFLNLIVNAVHAIGDKDETAPGTVRISTRSPSEGMVEIKFSDNGTGMPAHVAEHIFDPFFTTKEPGKGTGQGLTMVHNIITKKHKGTITFNSTPGEGTDFIIQLPVKARDDEQVDL